ncbi:MAG: redoxin family protein [Patescibacteria group bacterium]|nr:redoxin family protein [Patescibacteria group bacterium]
MVIFIVSFIAGILTVLAPCVLPLLPVTLGGAMAEAGNRKRPIVIIGSLAASVLVFTLLLKGSTALIGASPTFWAYISAAILTGFGLTLLFPVTWAKIVLALPGHTAPDSWMAKGYQNRSSWWGDVLVGAALGPVFTTCSPTFFVIVATVLPQSFGAGIADLVAYVVGLSLSLLLVAYVGQRLVRHLGWAIDPAGWFRKALGLLFIVVAVAIVTGWDKKAEAGILDSGFFDVTALEQSIHMSLQGPSALPSAPGSSCAPGQLCAIPSPGGSPRPALSASSSSLLPPPPPERDEGRYVEIKDPAGFVNTPGGAPLSIGQFVGKKVVLVDFIDYSCINCERTFPYLESWWKRYGDQGLEVIAIHTPEFAFEKDIANVRAAAERFGLTFPIVLDNGYATWNAYGNEYWPHKYLIDIHGNVVYDKIGEGGDSLVESEIVKLLDDRMAYLGQKGSVSAGTSTMPDYSIQAESPETYLGAARNGYFGNGAPYTVGDATYAVPPSLAPNQFYLGGAWHIGQEYAQAAAASSSLSYVFAASKAYVILTTADGKPADAAVLIDGKPIAPDQAGADDSGGVIHIGAPRLYGIFSSPSGAAERHRVDIIFAQPGVRAYTFTFG